MFKRLNGWQRLWVVLVSVYLVPVVGVMINVMPHRSNYELARTSDSIEIVGRYLESNTPGYVFEGVYSIRQKHYGALTDEKIIERLHEKYKDKVDFSRVELEYFRKLDMHLLEQAKVAGYGVLFWLVPSLALYLLGVAVGWVIKGFLGDRR